MSSLPSPPPSVEPLRESDDVPVKDPTVDIADEVVEALRRESRTDRTLAMVTISLAMLALVVVIWTSNRRIARVEERLAQAVDRLASRQVELTALQQQLAGANAELAMTQHWLDEAQKNIDELQGSGRTPTALAAAAPRKTTRGGR